MNLCLIKSLQNEESIQQCKSNKIINQRVKLCYSQQMIFPADYRQRIIKQEKSRQYKAMLDQQIRSNSLINQQSKLQKRSNRIRTQPIELYNFRDKINSSTKQIPHQSNFLPAIHNNNIIDHNYKYLQPSTDFSNKKYFSNLPSKKYTSQKYNDEDLDDHLQKCLEQCDQLINGINKNFINLNNHLRSNSLRRKNFQDKNNRSKNFSEFDGFRDQQSRFSKGFDNLPVTSLRSSQLFGHENDVGRNQMMNYNISKAKEKQILHISTPGDRGNYSPANRDNYDNSMQKSGDNTKRKNLNDMIANHMISPTNKNKKALDFDTIKSDQQNQFTNIDLPHSMSNQLSDSIQKIKKQALIQNKKIAEQMKAHQQMKKKDNKIIENLRKAKNRGNILFKKIQVFKRQREQLQQDMNASPQKSQQSVNKSKADSRNSQSVGRSQSKLSDAPSQQKNLDQVSKQEVRELIKEIGYQCSKCQKIRKYKGQIVKQVQKGLIMKDKIDSRANSKLSKKDI